MDIQNVIQLIAGILTAAAAVFILPFIKSVTTASQRAALINLIKTAVAAAEQVSGEGSDKKRYVELLLEEKGHAVGSAETDAMIESAVYDLKSKKA